MFRSDFIALVAAALARPQLQEDKPDASITASDQALRVLLGKGSAQRIDAASFTFQGRRYRGGFTMLDDGHVVNTVSLEQYLYSVVPREMPPSWPQAALQAQAIIARTFVLQRSNPNRPYDLVPSEADQVYTGTDSEHPGASSAVDATANQVLRFADGFALAMYSSCCGGHTESSSAAWNGKPVAYLNGVQCTYCSASPWFTWNQSVELDRVQSALGGVLPPDFQTDGVQLQDVDPSGRSRTWVFDGSGIPVPVPAAKVRNAIGTRVLPSLRVQKIAVGAQAPRTLSIEGAGLGHGVGLCQWGARGLAQTGAATGDILRYYYPGTQIGND